MSRKIRKRALITGITGQDGSYLAELLLSKGYQVYGMVIEDDPLRHRNIEEIKKDLKLYKGNLNDKKSLIRIVKTTKPDEIYNLGYDGPPFKSNKNPDNSIDITGLGAVRLFAAVKDYYPKAKVFQASSASMFNGSKTKKSENSKMEPLSIYGIAKLLAHNSALIMRQNFGTFISCGILFNHTSPRASRDFVVPKITYAAACAKLGIKNSKDLNEVGDPIVKNNKLKLGNINVVRDISYAADCAEAMWLMLQQKQADDYVIGTGKGYSIKDICQIAYSYVGLDWEKYVTSDKKLMRKSDPGATIADISKAKRKLGWKPRIRFDKLVAMMVDDHIEKLAK